MRRLKFIAAIPIIAYLIYASNRDDSNFERNKKPKENLRQATSVAQMWSSGVSANLVPITGPAAASVLLQEVIESKADESVKQEARQVQQKLNAHPHFVRFANEIEQFKGEFERIRAVIDKALLPDNGEEIKNDREIEPLCLVITAKRHDSERPDQDQDKLFFDAEMMNALGGSLATSPTNLKTLIVLNFSRAEDGEYRFQQANDEADALNPSGRFRMAAYFHACQVLVIDFGTESVVNAHRFEEHDPEKRTIVLLGKEKPSKDGYALLRGQVRDWIQKLSSSVR